MANQRGMPPWFFLGGAVVSVIMALLYVQLIIEDGFSIWGLVRIAFWVVFVWIFLRGYGRARRSRRNLL